MKKLFYIFVLLTTMLLNLTYAVDSISKNQATNWVDVPLTDQSEFNIACQYRFYLPSTQIGMVYATGVSVGRLMLALPDFFGGGYTVSYFDKSRAKPIKEGVPPEQISQLQSRCD
ncbi:MAG: hypothetical protein K0R49_77 [Burkholderiales bacterium]|jgi:hypothetical protein|nr:hypothetical protein [Burkholderiales bacterium]